MCTESRSDWVRGVKWGWAWQPLHGATCCQLQLSKKAPPGSDSREQGGIRGRY